MKLVRWEFIGLHMPMMEDDAGILYCTSQQLAKALNSSEGALRFMRYNNAGKFKALSVRKTNAKEFLQQNSTEFGIQRVREDSILWCEDDMILAAVTVKSDMGDVFRSNLVQFIKANARRDYVSKKEYDAMEARVVSLTALFEAAAPYMDAIASHAGKALRAHAGNKALRLVANN